MYFHAVAIGLVLMFASFAAWSDQSDPCHTVAVQKILNGGVESAEPLVFQKVTNELLQDFAKFKELQFHPEFFKNLAATKQLLKRWYYRGDMVAWIDAVEKKLGPEYVPLLIHPGLANRAAKFVEFAKSFLKANPAASPRAVFDAFSKSLGTMKVYRGMVVKPAHLQSIKKNGILAPALLDQETAKIAIQDMFDPTLGRSVERGAWAANPLDHALARLDSQFDPQSLLTMSVTRYPEIAQSVGYHSSPLAGTKGTQMVVFELEIPAIEIISKENLYQFLNEGQENVDLLIGKKLKFANTDPGVEMFVFYRIGTDPKQMIKQTEIAGKIPSYQKKSRSPGGG